ncbi:MAG: YicC/YloC family endoribonuclease [Deltaproteobacteria bacterium]
MRSMTGFGRGVAEHAGVRATVDLRSVNHRFLDLKLRAQIAPSLEDQLATKIRGSVERGSISVAVNIVRPPTASSVRIDEGAAQRAHEALRSLATTLGVAPPDLALVLAQPGVVATTDSAEEPEAADAAILGALDQALAQLQAMRAAEGRALERELLARLDELAKLRGAIEGQAAGVAEQLQQKLRERLARLIGDAAVDPARLAQEVALLAERADITEELVRLDSHLEQARTIAKGATASGRKLDFLVQEIGRELNTIGSKSQRTEISAAIVEAKSVLEKMREQVQNVE